MTKATPKEAWLTIIGFIKGLENGEVMVGAIDIINEHFGLFES